MENPEMEPDKGESNLSERDRIVKSGIAELLLSALDKSGKVQDYDFRIERLAGHPRIMFESNKPDKTSVGSFDIDDGEIFDLGITLTPEQVELVDKIIAEKQADIEKN